MQRNRKVEGIIFEMCMPSLCQMLILVFLITEIKKDLGKVHLSDKNDSFLLAWYYTGANKVSSLYVVF